ncbi:tRNA-specific adenosine deaminase, partial [Burkholderia cenocepacia]
YVEIARPLHEREMKLVYHRARDDGPDLYEAWQVAQGS